MITAICLKSRSGLNKFVKLLHEYEHEDSVRPDSASIFPLYSESHIWSYSRKSQPGR